MCFCPSHCKKSRRSNTECQRENHHDRERRRRTETAERVSRIGEHRVDHVLPPVASDLLGGPRQYAQTSMVLVMSSASQATAVSFGEASNHGALRVAVVDPKVSSLGAISVKALKQMDPSAPHHARLVPVHHTDEVVRLVSGGEADVGVVYRADAINSGQVRIIDEVPAERSIPVVFGQAVVSTCRKDSLQAAEQFLNFMMSPRIQKLLLKYGFDAISTKATVG